MWKVQSLLFNHKDKLSLEHHKDKPSLEYDRVAHGSGIVGVFAIRVRIDVHIYISIKQPNDTPS